MNTNLKALEAIVTLIADAVNDAITAVKSGGNALTIMEDFMGLIPELMALIPQLGDIPKEVSSLSPTDVLHLVQLLESKLVLPTAQAEASLGSIIDIINLITTDIFPAIQALINLVKSIFGK